MEKGQYINPVGFSEMYEWSELPYDNPFGLFVSFDMRKNRDHSKIVPANSVSNKILGISTVQSVETSDDPDKWKFAYLCNEVGDKYLQKVELAVGTKQYDQFNEISYIQTSKYETYKPVPTENYNQSIEYVPRTKRKEWVRVNMLGKVIVRDNGECQPGEYCQPYSGKEKKKYGTAVPADETSGVKFYVMNRITNTTIEVVNSPMMNKVINTSEQNQNESN